MTKQEALKYLAEKSDEGWMTHEFLLSIYDDDEDIPKDILDLICHQPTPPHDIVFIVGERLKEDLDIACTHNILLEGMRDNPRS